MKTALLIAFMVLSDSSGDVFLTRGMKQAGEISSLRWKSLLTAAGRILGNASFLWGIACVAVSYFSFLIVLSWADLSLVFPAKSLVYLTSTLGAKWFLREQISLERWGGISLVCLGVALISLP